MRTTLNIDDDVLFAVKERARRQGRSASEVLSEVARRGLTEPEARLDEIAERESFYGFEPLAPRGRVVSNELIDRLRDEEGVRAGPSSTSTCSWHCSMPTMPIT